MPTQQKIIGRIQKLMAMANDDASPHEAAIALKRAQALMDKHQLSTGDLLMSQITRQSTGNVTRNTTRFPEYLIQLVGVISDAFECKAIYQPDHTARGSVVTFCGMGNDPLIAKYALEVLTRQLKKARHHYLQNMVVRDKNGQGLLWDKPSRQSKTAAGNTFAAFWVAEAGKKAAAIRSPLPPEKATLLDTYCQQTWPDLSFVRQTGTTDFDVEAALAGQQAAQLVQLHHGMTGEEQTKLGMSP